MKESLKDSYVRWLQGKRWDWWATPTFKNPHSQAHAHAAVHQWLAAIGPQACALLAYERGGSTGRIHVHAVIGGVGRSRLMRTRLTRAWRRGIITVDLYDPTKRCIRYMLDAVESPESVDIVGTLQDFRPKRQRCPRIKASQG